jgi:lipopolysaccharide export system protein LptC
MTAAYGHSEREPRAFTATHRADNARRFRAAIRHSRKVRILRVAIPLVVVLGCGALALMTWFNPLRLLARLPAISIGDVVVSGTKIKMENPKLSGFTRDARRYDLVAGAAAQDLTRPGVIELQEINATVEMQENTSMKLSAASGVFDTNTEILTLERNIIVTSTNGYEGHLAEATIDTRSGNVLSEKPVTLRTLNGTVNSNRLEILQAGDLIRFDKGVVVNMRMNNSPADSQSGGAR